MSAVKGFDWAAMMRAGLQGLGLKPTEFWELTPAELLMMLGDEPGNAPMGRDRFEALMARFPDISKKETDDVRPK